MANSEYRVTQVDGVRVVYGPVPITDMVGLLHGWTLDRSDEEWICDAVLAKRFRATMVCGPRAACEELRNRGEKKQ